MNNDTPVTLTKCHSHVFVQKKTKSIDRILITCDKLVLFFRKYTSGKINTKIPLAILDVENTKLDQLQ